MAQTDAVTPTKPSHLAWVLIALTLLIFAATLAMVSFHLRRLIHKQIVGQDGQILHAAYAQDAAVGDDPEAQFDQILETSKLRGVIAVRLFSKEGKLIRVFPLEAVAGRIEPSDLSILQGGQPVSHFYRNALLKNVVNEPAAMPNGRALTAPLVQAFIPLQSKGRFIGTAEFLLDGQNVAAAFEALDQDLIRYAVLLFVGGGIIVGGALAWTFRRLANAQSSLAERTANLLRANHELALAAKTSAIGAVTAHLLHELKNPLFGLQTFVSVKSGDPNAGGEWKLAVESTKRMQSLISDVVRILQEEKSSANYALTVEEVLNVVVSKFAAASSNGGGLQIRAEADCRAEISSRDGNLVSLVLTNLVQNAIQAMPGGGAIQLSARCEGAELLFEVKDSGPGIPPELQARLFAPVKSSKTGGTGVGLAISRQLARHLGGDLLLARSSAEGSVFRLRLPNAIVLSSPQIVSETVL